eukprot:TRINITY_DN14141_c0_g1_i1.p1 TRINITY_DN14141_c0_g1~~TRINITY_DN14141_c0_g1_i1.p1  ORF type:complete len:358 (+),score=49.42 TRINITY_DN14141_c0_g1_i1:185-1258(+)
MALTVAGTRDRTSIADDFSRFQSTYPLQKIHLPRAAHHALWDCFQAGPTVGCGDPIVFVHGTTGCAGTFFYQVDALAAKGYRVISAQYPAYYTCEEWCKGFDHFLDALKCRAVHLFGAGLGGFLAQRFADLFPLRVRSLILCNSFAATNVFAESSGPLSTMVHVTPTPLLRKLILDWFPEVGDFDFGGKQAIDWMAQRVNDFTGDELAARLTLNCTACVAGLKMRLDHERITLLESGSDTMVPDVVRQELRQRYPAARLAQLKGRGDFPYLALPEEVTLFVQVHLRALGAFGNGVDAPTPALEDARVSASTELSPKVSNWEDEYDHSESPPAAEAVVETTPKRKSRWVNPFQDDQLL